MRIYLTHCSKEKEPTLKDTDIAVTPDKLYTSSSIQRFMQKCREESVSWGILSDLYGVYLSTEVHTWYEKHPDTVTREEERNVIADFDGKLHLYDEIFFYIRPKSFHPSYERVLKKALLADRVKIFRHISNIK